MWQWKQERRQKSAGSKERMMNLKKTIVIYSWVQVSFERIHAPTCKILLTTRIVNWIQTKQLPDTLMTKKTNIQPLLQWQIRKNCTSRVVETNAYIQTIEIYFHILMPDHFLPFCLFQVWEQRKGWGGASFNG